VTDFRDEPNPQKEPAAGLVLKNWAGKPLDSVMAKVSPFKFMQEVRAEAQKVTWPTRKETTVTTIMVFVMVAIASVFFLLADQVMRIAVSFILGV
jgi:preprotein translocase subunit SecE